MKIHIVQKGESLWEIAKLYGVDFEKIQEVNPQLSSADMIMPGMKIMIPQESKTILKEKKAKEKKHKIKPLNMKEDDHKEKISLNMSMPSLGSMNLPLIEEPETGEIKQKEEIKAQFKPGQSPTPTKPKTSQPKAYPKQEAYIPLPHCCYCCPYQAHFRQERISPLYLEESYREPRYTGHLAGYYDYPGPSVEGYAQPQAGLNLIAGNYGQEIMEPRLPTSEENFQA